MESKYITRCFELAKKGFGKVSPNPLVGCVIVKEERIIGEGWHEEYGQPHAEINAIKNASEPVVGSTLHCNLEPCSHTNKNTPPCVPEIIKQKISKVVISNLDPNPDVNGKGIEQLKNAGVKVFTGIEEEKGNELNRFYFKYVKSGIPFISLKISQSLDGKITDEVGTQSWITGKESGKFVHSLRGIFDAVLIGANSVIIDDPLLTVRHTSGRNPVRIILDGGLSIPLFARIFNSDDKHKTWLVTGKKLSNAGKKRVEATGAKVLGLPLNGNNKINLNELLSQIGKQKISSILVEGGSNIFSQFIDEELFDELIVLQSPKVFGKGLSSVVLDKPVNLKMKLSEKLGDDLKMIFRKN
jgi:diaminohydroxyphosphoribosylaminopyrimidine deaminase/5-amino-6-(5-phosphoribosylamino)uracil reductase